MALLARGYLTYKKFSGFVKEVDHEEASTEEYSRSSVGGGFDIKP